MKQKQGLVEIIVEIRKLLSLSEKIRGSLLDLAIYNEGILSNIISQHFCPDDDRRALLFTLILNSADLKFSTKIEIFKNLLKLQYQSLIPKYPNVIKKLDRLRDFRNKLVHSILDTSDDFLAKQATDRIRLIQYKGGREIKFEITINERNKKAEEWEELTYTLLNIQNEIKKISE